jgi:hypothetical protein
VTWDSLRVRLRSAPPALYQLGPPPAGLLPSSAAAAGCAVCRGPVRPGFARCYQCGRHGLLGRGLLADTVVPVSYAIKGTAFAGDLWQYKSCPAPSTSARTLVLALLLAFLNDHGPCVWRHAAMPPPGRLAVVPTGCGRPGPHPLLRLVSPYLRLPLTPLAIRPGRQGRDLDLSRFRAGPVPAGASVLLLDDSWVSGASAQSAAAALKLAGASRVAIVVLGRHINPADPLAGTLIARVAPARYDPSTCAVHGAGISTGRHLRCCGPKKRNQFIPVRIGNSAGSIFSIRQIGGCGGRAFAGLFDARGAWAWPRA